jgi:hypothetical protein
MVARRTQFPSNFSWALQRGFACKYMRFFAEICPEMRLGQQAADHLPWFHIVTLLTRVGAPDDRAWHAAQAATNGWSRAALAASWTPHSHFERNTLIV